MSASREEIDSPRQALNRLVRALTPPEDFFSGLRLRDGLTPDNILFFRRDNPEAFRPDTTVANLHHRFELVVLLEKAGPMRIGESSHRLEPGEAALIFPNQFHHYMDVEPGNMEWLFITFELPSAEQAEALAPLRDSPRVLGEEEWQLLARMTREATAPSPLVAEIAGLLARLLQRLLLAPEIPRERYNIHSSNTTRDQVLEKINTYVQAHLSRAVTLADLAHALGYSESYLRAVFKDQLGISLGRYIRQSRLSEAAKLLQSTDLSISEIAQRTGFESPFAFSRAFKKVFGLPPRSHSKRVS